MSPRKPLFSRTQLNWIIIVLIVVIALLSLAPHAPVWPALQWHRVGGVSLLAPSAASDQPPRLRVVLRLPPYMADDAPVAELLDQLLSEQLAGLAGLRRQRLPDRVRLTLLLRDATAVERLLARLARRPAEARLTAAERRLTAARHLASHHTQAPLWPAGPTPLPPLAELYDRWLSRAQLRLLLNQPLDPTVRTALERALAQIPAGRAWDLTVPPLPPATQRSRDDSQLQLIRTLPGRTQPEYPEVQLTVRWLCAVAADAGISCDWQPRHGASRLSLRRRGQADDRPDALLADLRARLATADDRVAPLIERLQSRLQQGLDQPDDYLNLLEPLATYQLALDGLPRFAATIARLDATALQQRATELLDPAAFTRYPATPLVQEP